MSTGMTMEERIEAASRKLGYRHDDHTMRTVLAAAFPEMFDGSNPDPYRRGFSDGAAETRRAALDALSIWTFDGPNKTSALIRSRQAIHDMALPQPPVTAEVDSPTSV